MRWQSPGYAGLCQMRAHERFDDARMASLEAALRPHAWRRMSAAAIARRLVEELEGDVPAADDHRVWMVQRALAACRWRGLTIVGVARQAMLALEIWHASRRRLDAELASIIRSG